MLRSIDLDFSLDQDKKLTLVSGANECGKTTLFHAIGWSLFGKKYLTEADPDYILTPMTWHSEGHGDTCDIKSILKFKHTATGSTQEKTYRLIRTVREVRESQSTNFSQPNKDKFQLFEVRAEGDSEIESIKAQNLIQQFFPYKTRQLFLMNGDDIYTFMFNKSDKAKDRQEKVVQLMRTVLEIDTIDEALKHLKILKASLRKAIGEDSSTPEDLRNAIEIEGKAELFLDSRTEAVQEIAVELKRISDREIEINRDIARALVDGNKQEVLEKKIKLEKHRDELDEEERQVLLKISQLLESKSMIIDCLKDDVLSDVNRTLQKMVDDGEVPNQTVPYLQKKIEDEKCICGETLNDGSDAAGVRTQHIRDLIDTAEERDSVARKVSGLWQDTMEFGAFKEEETSFKDEYQKLHAEKSRINEKQIDKKGEIAILVTTLAQLGNTDVPALKKILDKNEEKKEKAMDDQNDLVHEQHIANGNLDDAVREREKIERLTQANNSLRSQLDFAEDAYKSFEETRIDLLENKVSEVSDLTNKLFLEMTGKVDPDIGAIRKVFINEDFEFRVELQGGSIVRPGPTLNGASLRALTLAFILALCQITDKDIPQFIDTPFGVTSDTTKEMIAKIALKNSTQIILALTFAEQSNIESTLIQYLSPKFSKRLTFSTHFETGFILNKISDISESKLCDCNFLTRNDCCNRTAWESTWPEEKYTQLLDQWNRMG